MINSMIITGIIVEYNPFHLGHLHHIQEAKRITECDLLIAVMSGHFVQRGEPAIVDKWKRTQAALDAGVDIVLELPFVYCVQEASRFAQAAVDILSKIGCTDIVFGSESNDLAFLQSVADLPINVDHLKENMKHGISYPKAYNLIHGPFNPNDILGIAYLKALKGSSINAHTIQRTNSYHSTQMDLPLVSASAIRKALYDHRSIQNQSPMEDVLNSSFHHRLELYYPFLRLKLITTPSEVLSELFLMSEGLENHLKECAKKHEDFDSFMASAITKRYTRARIQRTLIHTLTHTLSREVKSLPPIHSLRLLGFNKHGQHYLKHLEPTDYKIASRFNQVNKRYRDMEYNASVVYALALPIDEQKALIQREIEGPILKK